MLLRASHFPANVTHAFTTRRGGASEGRYASLNMGGRWGDDATAVRENLRRVAQWCEYEPDALLRATQVHGDLVVPATSVGKNTKADGIWAARSAEARVIGVMTADCVPILLCNRAGTLVAATHSGWRGTVANIAARSVEALTRAGARPSELLAAIGPCIEVEAFEVGEEVAAQFETRFIQREFGPKPHVDLVACVESQLSCAGIPASAIERVGGCTHRDSDTYFSYRRDGAGIGQHLSLIGWRTAKP